MKAAVILFPGSNRERDAARALHQATGKEPKILWHAEENLPPGTDLVVLPGGFSYGDYLRCGAIAARAPIMRAVERHVNRGGLVLGICNGFQILCEAGLLPGVLLRNANRRFICKMQYVRVENAATPFTHGYAEGQLLRFAIAHGEGNFEADDATIEAIEGAGQVAFRYCDAAGRVGDASNPNGSENGIAGVFNARFNVLGLMPHPENLIDPVVGGVDGQALFRALAA
jgi:phosphoribosylformylglycinamidine synthase subunit PurQ / glutaminase